MSDVDARSRPEWFDALLVDVDRAFEVTGADTPGWPDPHPDRNPLDDEYSRVTDVGKYRVLDARVAAWVRVLAESGLAETREIPPAPWIGGCRSSSDHLRVRRTEPTGADGLSVLFATTLVDGAPFGLDIGVARSAGPAVFLDMVPDCGCDACDSGSADLLEVLDGWVLTIARGGVVHARRGEAYANAGLNGWSTSGAASRLWLDETTPVPPGVERWAGAPWR